MHRRLSTAATRRDPISSRSSPRLSLYLLASAVGRGFLPFSQLGVFSVSLPYRRCSRQHQTSTISISNSAFISLAFILYTGVLVALHLTSSTTNSCRRPLLSPQIFQ